MIVTESTETAFGAEIKGVTIQLTMEEAKGLAAVLLVGIVNPPKARDGINTDWTAKEISGKVYDGIRKAAKI
jgi:hypothetical protein